MEKAIFDGVLARLVGSTFASIDTKVDVVLAGGKKNPMQGRVTKKTEGNRVMLFARGGHGGAYDNMVKRRLEAEGKSADDFELSPRAWGTRVEGTPYVEHKGEYYLECIFLQPGFSTYYLDGEVIDKNDIIGLKDPVEAHQGGLNDKVVIRTYKLSSIYGLRAMNFDITHKD